MLDPSESKIFCFVVSVIYHLLICKPIIFLGKNFLLKFRESNPKAYLMWYTNYKAKVEMQKLISRTKNGSECSTPLSTQLHDVYVYNKTIILLYEVTKAE